MSPNVVEDLTEESRLCQEYNRLVSSCTAEFHGETCTFSTLSKYMQNVDRSVRKESFQVWASMYEGIGDRLDDIYERMVAVRSRIAENWDLTAIFPIFIHASGAMITVRRTSKSSGAM